MKLAAGAAAAVLAVGTGLGTYFAFRGPAEPQVPKAQQSPTLERAKAQGVIDGYRVRRFQPYGGWAYDVDGAIRLSTPAVVASCGGDQSRPDCLLPTPIVFLEYRRFEAARAEAILRIAQEEMPDVDIKFFEVTTLG